MDEMIGKTYGNWTVLEKTEHRTKDKNILYLCKCTFGTIREVNSSSLRQGKSKSCGCTKTTNISNKIFPGKVFDDLIIEKEIKHEEKKSTWRCKCKCGKYCERSSSTLLRKDRFHSCGCYNIKILNEKQCKDLTNLVFGLLTVIALDNKNSTKEYRKWICKCKCGNLISVPTNSLTSGNTSSCGCINYSIGEKNIEKILKENNISFKSQYTTKELNKKRFDFAILQNEKPIRLIEFDGIQHYTDNSGIWNSKESLKDIQDRDKQKNIWAKDNNIPLVRIPYWERDKITFEMLFSDKYLVKENE